MIVAATQEHADLVADALTEVGARELAEVYGMSPREAARHNLAISVSSWTLFVCGKPLLMFGVHCLSEAEKVGELWTLGTRHICAHRVAFARACARFLPEVRAGWRELRAAVETSNADVMKWTQWCGAKTSPMNERLTLVTLESQ